MPETAQAIPAWKRLLPWGLAVLSGALYFVAFVGWDQFWLMWAALAPLHFALRETTLKRALLLGWLMGLVTYMGGFPWIVHTLHVFAYLPTPVAVVGYVLFCASQGLIFGAFALLYRALETRARWPSWLAGPVALAAAEFAFPLIFPSYTANAEIHWLAVIQIAELTGVIGITFLVGLTNAALFQFAADRARWKPLAAAAAAVAACAVYGYARIPAVDARTAAAPTMRIGIAQNNFGAELAHQNPEEGLARLQRQTAELARRGAELVVWPESGFMGALPHGIKRVPESVTGGAGVPLLFGTVLSRTTTEGRQIWNSAVLTDADGMVLGTYAKRVLLVFGEYIPLGETFPQIYKMFPYSGHFQRGRSLAPLVLDDKRLSTDICYEDILPRLVRALARGDAQGPPHALVNITNDSWYGDGPEQAQHLALAAFRSVEHRRFLVRATNTGHSAYVDPAGRILDKADRWVQASLLREVALLEGETVYHRFGDWFAWLCLAAAAAGLARGYWQAQRK
jgi:apolipoprotein N-acyltransferase